MKKIYITFLSGLLLFCGVVASSFGQSIKVIDAVTGAVLNDSVIMATDFPGSTMKVSPYIVNTGAAAINMRVEKVDINMLPNATHAFCVDLYCYDPIIFVSPSTVLMQPGDTLKSFYAEYEANGDVGTSYTRYRFYNDSKSSDSAAVFINYTSSVTSLSDAVSTQKQETILEVFPNPVHHEAYIRYQAPDASQVRLTMYNVLGTTVKKMQLNSNKGQVAVNAVGFKPGIYFCTLEADGKSISTKKFIVR